ncbi:MAG: hypothetical protein QXS32_08450 [Candidatus Nezhaarchaeales archaeon]
MELELAQRPTKKKKIQQIVWLEPKVFAKLAEWSEKYDVAVNVIVSEIVKKYVESGVEPIKVIERRNDAPAGFYCPMCIKRFARPADFIEHLKLSGECRERLKEAIG